jgi:hypothetical protein
VFLPSHNSGTKIDIGGGEVVTETSDFLEESIGTRTMRVLREG